jgi:hypothetical protein
MLIVRGWRLTRKRRPPIRKVAVILVATRARTRRAVDRTEARAASSMNCGGTASTRSGTDEPAIRPRPPRALSCRRWRPAPHRAPRQQAVLEARMGPVTATSDRPVPDRVQRDAKPLIRASEPSDHAVKPNSSPDPHRVPSRLDPRLDPVPSRRAQPPSGGRMLPLAGLFVIGETGFEPATARPPAGAIQAYRLRFSALQRSELL